MGSGSRQISCHGFSIRISLNGTLLHDVDLAGEKRALERGLALAERPRRGRIGFQELSRGEGHVQIRNAEIKEIESKK